MPRRIVLSLLFILVFVVGASYFYYRELPASVSKRLISEMTPPPTPNDMVSFGDDSGSVEMYLAKLDSIWSDTENSLITINEVLQVYPNLQQNDEYRFDIARLGVIDYTERFSAITPPSQFTVQHETIVNSLNNIQDEISKYEMGFGDADEQMVRESSELVSSKLADIKFAVLQIKTF